MNYNNNSIFLSFKNDIQITFTRNFSVTANNVINKCFFFRHQNYFSFIFLNTIISKHFKDRIMGFYNFTKTLTWLIFSNYQNDWLTEIFVDFAILDFDHVVWKAWLDSECRKAKLDTIIDFGNLFDEFPFGLKDLIINLTALLNFSLKDNILWRNVLGLLFFR